MKSTKKQYHFTADLFAIEEKNQNYNHKSIKNYRGKSRLIDSNFKPNKFCPPLEISIDGIILEFDRMDWSDFGTPIFVFRNHKAKTMAFLS